MWDYYQGAGTESFSGATPRLHFLVKAAKKISLAKEKKALNIGVGGGQLEEISFRYGFVPYSLDPSEIAIKKIKQQGFEGVVAEIDANPYDDQFFDIVFCSEVLEHLHTEILNKGVAEIHRVLKDRGYLIGTVPYSELLDTNTVICPHCAQSFHRWGHVQSFNKEALQHCLERGGFKIITLETRAFTSFKKKRFLQLVRAVGSSILGRLGVAMGNPSLFFIAQKI